MIDSERYEYIRLFVSEKRHQTRALHEYHAVLRNDDLNIWTTNSISCIY